MKTREKQSKSKKNEDKNTKISVKRVILYEVNGGEFYV